MTEMIPKTTVTEICGHRDEALRLMRDAVEFIADGHKLAEQAQQAAARAYGVAVFTLSDRSSQDSYARLFKAFDPARSLEVWRQQIEARIWMNLITLTGMSDMMDRTAKDELYDDLCGDVAPVTEENVWATFDQLMSDSGLIFQRGLARTFADLDRRFKSHDAFKLGSRIILTNAFDCWGCWNHHSRMRDTLADVERCFSVLDGKEPNCGALAAAISKDREGGFNPRQSETVTEYFKVRTFKNGNAHLWLLREDLVDKANQTLAAFYGEVLPDARTGAEVQPDDLRSADGTMAKNLSFYPTPDAVVAEVLKGLDLGKGCRVLEPSAGEGSMAVAILRSGASCVAIEVDPSRLDTLRRRCRHSRLASQRANFLAVRATGDFTHVVMNPPFYGTHWMQHVIHAFDFLGPEGTLVAVLPVTAVLGETKKHRAFRKWAEARTSSHWGPFRDLPSESFAESGTRINTVVLTVHKCRSFK